MNQFTKKQKIFLAFYPSIQMILYILIGFAAMGSAVGNSAFLGFDLIINPLFWIFCLPAFFINNSFDKAFFSAGGGVLTASFKFFVYIAYAYFLGFVFVILYKKIRNR